MKFAVAQFSSMCIATYLAITGLVLLMQGNDKMNSIVPDYYYEDELAYRQIMSAQDMQQWGVALMLIAGLIAVAAISSAWCTYYLHKREQRSEEVVPLLSGC